MLSKLEFYYTEYRRSANLLIDLILVGLLAYFAFVSFPSTMMDKAHIEDVHAALVAFTDFLGMPGANLVVGFFFAALLPAIFLVMSLSNQVSTDYEVTIKNEFHEIRGEAKWLL
jgi:hypothetical protein